MDIEIRRGLRSFLSALAAGESADTFLTEDEQTFLRGKLKPGKKLKVVHLEKERTRRDNSYYAYSYGATGIVYYITPRCAMVEAIETTYRPGEEVIKNGANIARRFRVLKKDERWCIPCKRAYDKKKAGKSKAK